MVTPYISQSGRVGGARAPRTDGECLRYRLDVVADSPADVVQSAGGWLYDRVAAGWEVTALLPKGCDTGSLRVLGVRALDVEARFGTGSTSQSLAVSAAAFTADARVRDNVLASLADPLTEVALWGDAWPLGIDRSTTRAQHLLSAAARRFKGYALAVAGIACTSVGPTETLLCDGPSAVYSELIRLG